MLNAQCFSMFALLRCHLYCESVVRGRSEPKPLRKIKDLIRFFS